VARKLNRPAREDGLEVELKEVLIWKVWVPEDLRSAREDYLNSLGKH